MYLAILLFILPFAFGAPACNSASNCLDLIVPVTVTAPQYPLNIPVFQTGYDAAAFLIEGTGRHAPADNSAVFGDPENITATYDISIRYCAPTSGQPGQSVHLLTHGLGFDKTYWHLQFGDDAQYNYAHAANSAGYPTLSYDRLSNGKSTIVDPYNELQAQVELAILIELTKLLRSGALSSEIPIPEKVVHVGHSFGSVLSNAVAANAPDITDGVVLTGFTHALDWFHLFTISTGFHLARENQPDRFGDRSSGFLTWGDRFANQYAFLTYPFFDPAVLSFGEANKFPFGIGEFLSLGSLPLLAPTFDKPVLLYTPSADVIFCGGDCYGVVDGPDSVTPQVFAAANPLEIYIQPNTGHAMNLHFNATAGFDVIFDFLGRNGL